MRKRLITPIPRAEPPRDERWLDLDGAAVVEVTSEEKGYPSSLRWSQEKRGAGVPPIVVFEIDQDVTEHESQAASDGLLG
jgi:hypothetical protein